MASPSPPRNHGSPMSQVSPRAQRPVASASSESDSVGNSPTLSQRMRLDPLSSDAVEPADNDLPELYDTTANVFTAYGMRINRRLKSLICLACQAVVLPQNVKPHLSKLHSGHKIRVDEELIMATAATENITTTWPVLPAKGIPVHQSRYMKEHAKKVHGLTVDSHTPLRHHLMQRLANHPDANSWFPVYGRPSLSPSPDAQYLSELRKKLDERPSLASDEVDHRHVSPWHTTTGWYTWLAGKRAEDIFPFSDYPKSPDAQWTYIIKWVQGFFDRAYSLPVVSSELALQILNTENSKGELNHTPFGSHQMSDTRQAYRHLFTRLIIFLLRISDPTRNYDLEIPVGVEGAFEELRQAALSPDAANVHDEHDVLIGNMMAALWSEPYRPVGRTLFNDPTIRFVIHTQVNPDLSLKDPREVTGILAKLTYCMRLVFLAMAHRSY
ncbi:hypothetical protein C8T65DRAFT_750026 [Cerioporus squamosus]|nr:hypothetical protein C8T65DRAFT_750026 [Cerioporus squamosus]